MSRFTITELSGRKAAIGPVIHPPCFGSSDLKSEVAYGFKETAERGLEYAAEASANTQGATVSLVRTQADYGFRRFA